ncbi:MAG: DUF4878 domain-containing protein [Dysgonamonadaceae bacterium]|jgi:hypothetical protein|nr:DUF4878 domain-containing protein [Dysgonamonadaceae bacterium]
MRKVFYLLFAAILVMTFTFTSCDAGGNTPVGITRTVYTLYQRGNYEKAFKIMCPIGTHGLNDKDSYNEACLKFVEATKRDLGERDGIKSFEILGEETQNGGKRVMVEIEVFFGNGDIKTRKSFFIKENGKWIEGWD